MKIINTFMHEGRVLRPGSAIPENVSDGELLEWKNNGLIGSDYDGPTRRSQPAPAETKPLASARKVVTPKVAKPVAEPNPAETKDASKNEAPSADTQTSSDLQDSQKQQDQAPAATDGVAAVSESKSE